MRAGSSGLLANSLGLSCLLIASVAWLDCGARSSAPHHPQKWTTGFWFWNGSAASVETPIDPIDSIFCHVGSIRKQTSPIARDPWAVHGDLPEEMPAAREYWLVFRFDRQAVPAVEAAAKLTPVFSELQENGRRRGLPLAGIQLDIDSPTGSLRQYASFLREVRKGLQPGTQISITALLDWFREGTAIGEVIKEVDEFVPQFYDVDTNTGRVAIATRFEAARWGPVFNRYQKRFRIGISTFGRARLLRREGSKHYGYAISTFPDVRPLDIAIDPAFELQVSRTDANELVLNYRAGRKTRVGYTTFNPSDAFQFILPTPEGTRAAVEQAKLIHGFCAGVVFFRWPADNETLTSQPGAVLSAAGVITQPGGRPAELRTQDGGCAAVFCTDLFLLNASPLSEKVSRYRIASSNVLEYFMPNERTPVRMLGPSHIELSLPAYCGLSRMYLGRAVTANRAEFKMEKQR